MAASARVLGWGQRVANGPAGIVGLNLNASNNTALDPKTSVTAMSATDQPFEVQAGVSLSVRWGGTTSTLFGSSAVSANTRVWTLNIFYDTGQNLWETGATDTLTQTGTETTLDRTLTFTPTHSGTVRLFVRYRATVTVGGALIADLNTDGASFGSPAETLPATSVDVGAKPGLLRAGTTLSSFAQTGGNGSGVYATYGKTIVNTLTTGHAPKSNEAAQTYTIAWKQGGTQFTTTTVPSGTSLTPADPGLLCNNVWPVASFSPNLVLTPNNSALSTNASGTGLPFIHYTSAPSSPGTVTTTLDGTGKIVGVTFSSVFTADNRLTIQAYMQLNTITVQTPPDTLTDLTHNVTDKTPGDVGEIATRVKDANGVGINGITFTTGSITIDDIGSLVAPTVRSGNNFNTTTLNGANGWITASAGLGGGNANFLGWASGNPTGYWNYTYTIAKADAVGLENPASPQTFALEELDPNVHVAAFLNGITTNSGGLRHVQPGDTLKIVATATNELTGKRLTPDGGYIWMTHFNSSSQTLENLVSDTDNTSAAFSAWGPTTVRTKFSLTPNGSDATLLEKTFSATAGWGNFPLVIRINLTIGGVDYPVFFTRELPGNFNHHHGNA